MIGKILDGKELYEEMIAVFSSGKSDILSGIDFESSVHLNRNKFVSDGLEILDMRSVSARDIERLADILQSIPEKDTREQSVNTVCKFVEKALGYKSFRKSSRSMSALYEWIFNCYMSVSTEIFFSHMSMDKLSIGQKGTVLLKLFLAEGDYPLIVDQPEENLDNMYIYDELVDAFRQAKTRRQVIIATNNANLVVNTDAEQVIVAEFKDNEISYRTGAIEDRSIRTDITTILEGGEEALRKREQKYGM